MTKFTSIEGSKKSVKTVFTHVVMNDKRIEESTSSPSDYDNAMHIGYDSYYGDVFKVWSDHNEGNFALYFGTKGDEFE